MTRCRTWACRSIGLLLVVSAGLFAGPEGPSHAGRGGEAAAGHEHAGRGEAAEASEAMDDTTDPLTPPKFARLADAPITPPENEVPENEAPAEAPAERGPRRGGEAGQAFGWRGQFPAEAHESLPGSPGKGTKLRWELWLGSPP